MNNLQKWIDRTSNDQPLRAYLHQMEAGVKANQIKEEVKKIRERLTSIKENFAFTTSVNGPLGLTR